MKNANYDLQIICQRANQFIRNGIGKSAAFKNAWAGEKAAAINALNFSEMARLFEEKKSQIESLQAEQDALKAAIIDYMGDREEIEENGIKAKYITVIRQILDTPSFKREQSDLYQMYLRDSESKRFTLTA